MRHDYLPCTLKHDFVYDNCIGVVDRIRVEDDATCALVMDAG